ncbi:DUF3307 domain-containing protein [Candidatus Collinsella stercoripullorum]|uniref:DUF3307 domain-containing protein n=1 Tax=Candidatus Collinsella stercoripullorum TaxID=2838522 RepID=UPI0022E0B6E2|nr:DUF3307 domain-containing protein [Candidatus Collinsella stercoripullorum]
MGLARSFLVIVFLHVLGDFYFQTDSMAKQKGEQKRIMALHCVEYSLCILPLFLCWRPSRVSASAFFFICATHFLVDALAKPWAVQRVYRVGANDNLRVFCIDQFVHLIACLIAGMMLVDGAASHEVMEGALHEAIPMLLALLIAVKPSGLFIRLLLSEYRQDSDCSKGNEAVIDDSGEQQREGRGAGEAIGWLERVLVVVLSASSEFSAIAFVVTAKSIARFKKIEEEPVFAETYLIGTLTSVSAAMLSTLFIFWCWG